MVTLRLGGILEPAMARATAVFQSTASGLYVRVYPSFSRAARVSQDAAQLVSVFLTPASVLAMVFGLWRLSADLEWTANFPIANGLFSHWLVWIGVAIGLRMTASLLDRSDNGSADR
jgi:hypothetical protein